MSRVAIRQLIIADNMFSGVPVHGTNVIDTPTEQRWVVLNFQETTPAFGVVGPSLLDIWVYDKDRDYTEIERMLDRIRAILTAAVHVTGGDYILTQADWLGRSRDMFDSDWNACMQYDSYRYVTRPVIVQ